MSTRQNFKWMLLVVMMNSSIICLAENSTPVKENPADTVKEITNPTVKKERKKKAQMCAECGKPEHECECKDHKEVKKNK